MVKIVNRISLLVICLSLGCHVMPALSARVETIENNEVLIHYDAPLHNRARELMRLYSSSKDDIEIALQSGIDFKPTVRLIRNRSDFLKATGSEHAVAVAVPRNGLIIVDNSKMRTHPFTLEATLKHELCHLLLYSLAGENRLPRWFNEGVSQWVSGGINEIIIGENKDLLKQATLSGKFIRTSDLTERFPDDRRSLRLAYQQSKSIIDYIVQEYGVKGILHIMDHLREGHTIDTAVIRALSITVDELEKRWHAYLKRKYTWFTYLSNHIYQVLFALAGLVLLYGFIRVILKKRAYKDEEEDDAAENRH